MRSRRSGARAIAWLVALGAALLAPAAHAQSIDGLPESRFVETRESFTQAGGAAIDLRFLIAREAAGQTTRVVTATHAALTMLSGWFGPLPSSSLTVAGMPWRGSFRSVSQPGLIAAPVRWLTPVRDQSTERGFIGALVRQYWTPAPSASPFEQALNIYVGTRAIHQLLEGSNFAAPRFFGGLVPFPLRSVLLSPPVADPRPRVWGFEELEFGAASDETRRAVVALQTLERYVGWPTMLESLSQMRAAKPARLDPEALVTALSAARGTEMRALVMACLRPDAVFDYSLEGMESRAGSSGFIETTLTIQRRGSGAFAISDAAGERDATMPLRVSFADGAQAFEYFDAAAPSVTRVYSTKAAAVSASIDPDVMLLLDVNRENNAIVRDAPMAPLGVRLALHWVSWLQNVMLSYTAML